MPYRHPCDKRGVQLVETHRLIGLAELEGQSAWADMLAAWSEAGVALTVHVRGKRQPPWCRAAGGKTATACTSGSTRAMSTTFTAPVGFATGLSFCPGGAGRRLDQPVAELLPINRAGSSPNQSRMDC